MFFKELISKFGTKYDLSELIKFELSSNCVSTLIKFLFKDQFSFVETLCEEKIR